MKAGDQRLTTDTRFNQMFAHPVWTIVLIKSVNGSLVEYTVDGNLYFTRLSLCLKYSE
jgi:hypothetical protein